MPMPLGLVQAHTAGEDQVGTLDQGRLTVEQRPRRAEEERQLVHAVVDDQGRLDRVDERLGHGRVHPGDRLRDLLRGDQLLNHGEERLRRLSLGSARQVGKARTRDEHVVHRSAQLPTIPITVGGQRLFDVDHGVARGEAGQQVLRTLKDEVPPQMREHDQGELHGYTKLPS